MAEAVTRIQRGVNARVGDEKQGEWKKAWARNGVSLSCLSCFLGSQHDSQLLVHTFPSKMVIHRALLS